MSNFLDSVRVSFILALAFGAIGYGIYHADHKAQVLAMACESKGGHIAYFMSHVYSDVTRSPAECVMPKTKEA